MNMDTSFSDIPNQFQNNGNRHKTFFEAIILRWLRKIERGHFTIEFPSGARYILQGLEPEPVANLKIHDFRTLYRLLAGGDTGFAEGYMAGEWETSDLAALLRFGTANEDALSGTLGKHWVMSVVERLRHGLRANTLNGSRRNIAAHYDLGNSFYGQWLDETMTYSSAIFEDVSESMVVAQRRKYMRLAEKLELTKGDCVLEIGCGWGGFAEIAAAEFGCKVVCLTLSNEQAAFARERMVRKGLSHLVEIRIQDYRDVEGSFDKIASIEMFEAVGEKYWPTYLKALHHRLKPGGRAGLQIITIEDDTFETYRRNPDFIQRYIFPGGMLPGKTRLAAAIDTASLKITDSYYFGASYAETLRRWDEDFTDAWPKIEALGFDQRFYLMWHYYLCYCMIGFEHGTIDVGQFVIEHK